MSHDELDTLAAGTLAALGEHTLAIAESLTGGLISAALTQIPGASRVFRGSVVSYATEIKVGVLGVSPELVQAGGVVQETVVLQMAAGVCRQLDSDFGLAATGVAGPAPQDGKVPGVVFLAAVYCSRGGEIQRSLTQALQVDLAGVAPDAQRAYIRHQSVIAALVLLKSLATGSISE